MFFNVFYFHIDVFYILWLRGKLSGEHMSTEYVLHGGMSYTHLHSAAIVSRSAGARALKTPLRLRQ